MQQQNFYYNYSFALVISYKHLMFLVFFISQYVNERFSYNNNIVSMMTKRKMLYAILIVWINYLQDVLRSSGE